MPSCIADGLVISSSLPTYLKVIGRSIMALYATVTTSETASLGFRGFVTKTFHPEQTEQVADLNAEAIIHSLIKNRSTAWLGSLAAAGLHHLLSQNWGGMGLYHCPNIKWQQAVQAGSPCTRQGTESSGIPHQLCL